MRALFFLVPIALAAAAGGFWYTSATTAPSLNTPAPGSFPKGSQTLFGDVERSLRTIIRHGDSSAIETLGASLDTIVSELDTRKKQGFAVGKIEQLLTQYRLDSTAAIRSFTPKLRELRLYDSFEHDNEPIFRATIEQIGLYELKTAYDDLKKSRSEYIKKPSAISMERYIADADKVQNIISELYLDSDIETPLYAYLDNHKLYLETIASAYEESGIERINRLRTIGYAIKTELQLLPLL